MPAAIAVSTASLPVLFEAIHKHSAVDTIATPDPAGSWNVGAVRSLLRRRTGSAAHVAAYIASRAITLIATNWMNVPESASPRTTHAENTIEIYGVRNLGF